MKNKDILLVGQALTRKYIANYDKTMRNKFKHIQVSFDYSNNRKDKMVGKHFYNRVVEKHEKGRCLKAVNFSRTFWSPHFSAETLFRNLFLPVTFYFRESITSYSNQ